MPQKKTQPETLRSRVKALSHELRHSIIGVLWEQPASAAEIAAALDEPVDKIRYQLRILLDAGLIEVHREHRKRGTVERVYAAREQASIITEEEMRGVSEDGRVSYALHLLKAIFRSSLRAVSQGKVAEGNSLISWSPILVDAQGLEDLRAIHIEMVHQVQAVKAESARRLGDPEEGISATSIVVWFENSRSNN